MVRTGKATFVYHFTHKDNLPTILSEGHVYCDKLRVQRGLVCRNLAYTDLKERRAETAVNVSPGGYLDHYVPFYFGTRSPMMFVYSKGGVTGQPENLNPLVYLVAKVEDIRDAGLRFVFTDGHPVRMPRFFSNDLAELARVDFPLMEQTMWNDTDDDPDRMRRRQAEFLVYGKLPWGLVGALGVRTRAVAAEIRALVSQHVYKPRIIVRSDWYY